MYSNSRKRPRQDEGKGYERSKKARNLPDKPPAQPQPDIRFTSPELNYTWEREEFSPLEYHPALPELLPELQGQNDRSQYHPTPNFPLNSAHLPGFPLPNVLLPGVPPFPASLPNAALPSGPRDTKIRHQNYRQMNDQDVVPPESNGLSNDHRPWQNMIRDRCFDAPIPRSLTDLKLPPEKGLFRSGGPEYINHLNKALPTDDLTSQPSQEYLATTLESPTLHDVQQLFRVSEAAGNDSASHTAQGPPPRHLVVLDLNGSLLFRSENRKEVGALGRIRPMTRRPYVGCLAKYLAHERTRSAVIVEQRYHKKVYHLVPPNFEPTSSQGHSSKKKKKKKKKKQQQQQDASTDPKLTALLVLQKKRQTHPENFTLQCALDAMVWSSVQPHNLSPMIDAAFGAEQAALRACWTRGMLRLEGSGFFNKVQTTKNLETVWWSSEDAYTARSMLLIDDTLKKARLQPWNLLQIPEYTRHENKVEPRKEEVNVGIAGQHGYSPSEWQPPLDYEPSVPEVPEEEEKEGDDDGSDDEGDGTELDPDTDTTLLAVIGILEELRFQSNIPAWIRMGNISSRARGEGDASTQQTRVEIKDGRKGAAAADDEGQLWCADPAVLAHWVKKGKGALAGRGIPVEVGILDVTEDQTFLQLRGSMSMY